MAYMRKGFDGTLGKPVKVKEAALSTNSFEFSRIISFKLNV